MSFVIHSASHSSGTVAGGVARTIQTGIRITMQTQRKTVFLALQQPLLRTALELRISQQPDLLLVGDSHEPETALRLIIATKPDIALIEDHPGALNGRELAARIRSDAPEARIVLLLPHGARERISDELRNLSHAILLSDDQPSHIVRALRTVASGERFVCPLLGMCNACDGYGDIDPKRFDALDEIERDIIGLMVEQQSAHQISRYLEINYRELHRRREAICEKLNIDPTEENTLNMFVIRHQQEFKKD